ncbi:MAG: DUF3619 family protein, partial [Gammaproteobacteria bacterium]|nr:DUF3619 family protein [Gammaproteobacteria bacterium]
MNSHDQQQLLNQICATLDQSVAQLDDDLQSRLDVIRSQALSRQRVTEPVNDSEESLVMAARVALDDSIGDLDPSIQTRLDAARKSALARSEASDSAPGLWAQLALRLKPRQITLPVGAFATACVLVTVANLFLQFPEPPASELAEADVLLFASSDEIE